MVGHTINMAPKVIKSFSLPEDVVTYLEAQGNASAEVTRLVRRRMLSDSVEGINGPPTPEARERARAWARKELTDAHEAVEAGAYDEVRRQMGWSE
jgi:hypothetical protein